MRSLQCADSQAEPRHASLPGFTQTGTVIVSDNLPVCYTCWGPCNHLVLIHQTSSALENKQGNTTGNPKYPFLQSPEIQTSRCCYCVNMKCMKNMRYPFIFPLCVIVHVDSAARSSERPLDSPISLDRFLNCPCLFVVDAITCD